MATSSASVAVQRQANFALKIPGPLRIVIAGYFLVLFCSCVLGQGEAPSSPAPFNQYGRMPWRDELKILDTFAEQLKKQPEMTGYIYIQEAQISGAGYAVGHAIEMKKYLIRVHGVRWNRVAWRDLGFGDGFVTSLWFFPTGKAPLYEPAYKPPTNETFIEGMHLPGRRRRRR